MRMLLVDTAARGLPLGRLALEVVATAARLAALVVVHVRQGWQGEALPQGREGLQLD